MSNSISYDKSALEAAIGTMASAYQPVENKFGEVVKAPDELTPAWMTTEGTDTITQFQNITTGVDDFKSTYSSLTDFLSSSVSVNYSAIEEELAAALAGNNTTGGN